MEQKQQKRTPERRENLQSQALSARSVADSLQCKYCGCETKKDVIKAAHWTKRGLIAIEDIPARVCQGCGEQFFEEEVAQRIQKALTYPAAKAKRQIHVPVYSLSQVRVAEKKCRPEIPEQQHAASLESTHRHTTGPTRANQNRQEAFLCTYCESATVENLVKSVLWVDGGLIAVENIPARVCQRCGEQFYNHETTEKLAALGKRGFVSATARRNVLVPVFSLADIKESLGKRHHRTDTFSEGQP
ncbi:MAG: YgiT-type zinc finger protein [Planctomycetota bacterium]|nr:YgiT-type zinc finger protein [Planctomycetota bacterium]